MAEKKWSREQQTIIDSRNKNLLVSAAAGAGKTTVMIERIIGLITQEVDIDSLLIVTFTRDASANMREKLSNRLTIMLDEDPGNKRLIRQQMLLQNAMITTIDSFCNSVVREFFYRTDTDPAFRIADNAEIALLRKKVLDDLLEEKYSSADQGFMLLVESFCGTRNDDRIGELADKLAKAAYAQAWPREWLKDLKTDIAEDIGKTELRSSWREQITANATREAANAALASELALKIAADEYKRLTAAGIDSKTEARIQKVISVLTAEAGMTGKLRDARDYEELKKTAGAVSYDRLTIGGFGDDIKEEIKEARDKGKNVVKKMLEKWFSDTEENMARHCSDAAPPMIALIDLTLEYLDRLASRKKEKNIYEFSDISHFALEILASKDDEGNVVPTEAALELRHRFHDIFIDEYQDSDAVQEQIAEIIAGAPGDSPYTFMVGDVKQSIYKFRMAKPELFIERASRYSHDPGLGELIRLGYNYRSGREVIESVNDVFRLCMHESVGKVEYDKGSELVKMSAGESSEDGADITEIIIAAEPETGDHPEAGLGNTGGPEDAKADNTASESTVSGGTDDPKNENTEDYTSAQLCAKAAAQRIRRLLDSDYMIRDEKAKSEDGRTGVRKIRYGDIVILLRSASGAADIYKEELENLGIPAYTDSGSGFIGSYEISVIINFLRLLDNPYQDIPLVSVLRSMIGGLNDDELARIRISGGFSVPFWQCVRKYAEEGTESRIKVKCAGFLELYSEIRKMDMTRDIDRVIFAIYEKTGFYLYCSALPSGQSRASNLELLLEYATQYEKGNYSGLFDFVGYIEEISKAEDDLEEAVSAEASNAVRIMTIHKSKGLEFPVVVLANAAKQFNLQDRNSEVIISPDYGIASKCIRLDQRLKYNTVRRMLAANAIELDTIGEELRLLYVAMTRAMQKLIIVGKPGGKGRSTEDWIRTANGTETRFSDPYIASVSSYMDVLYPAAVINSKDFLISEVSVDPEETETARNKRMQLRMRFENIGDDTPEEDASISEMLNYSYKADPKETLPIKLSVSDIKHAGMEEEGVATPWRNPAEHKNTGSRLTGAERGTLYHKVMQFIPFDLGGVEEVKNFLDCMAGLGSGEACGRPRYYGIISAMEREELDERLFAQFLSTDIADRMRRADAQHRLFREQPFMIGLEACEIDPEKYAGRSELIPVQGIIDCMFEEDDGMVILDYKTDLLNENEGDELVKRYHRQLGLYARAASGILGKNVKEKILYSFTLGKCFTVDKQEY